MGEKKEKLFKIEDGGLGYVKGYDLRTVTLKKIEKNKLGDALNEIIGREQLESEIKTALDEKCPVWGYFKKGQMWSCFIFERTTIEKSSITPPPETPNDTLQMLRLKREHVHPTVTEYYDKMKAGVFTALKSAAMEPETDGKKTLSFTTPDGFIWGDKTYVIKKTKSGIPTGLLLGLGVGVCFGIAMDSIALGLCMGLAIGLCYGAAFSQGEIVEAGQNHEPENEEKEH